MPFRTAHEVSGRIVRDLYASRPRLLVALTLADWQRYDGNSTATSLQAITPEAAVAAEADAAVHRAGGRGGGARRGEGVGGGQNVEVFSVPLDPIDPKVMTYLDALVPPRSAEVAAMEVEAARTDFPIVGPASAQFCYLMARAIGARSVFELGSGFGYSTAWFARAVEENGGGVVHHTVWDEDLSKRARAHLAALGYAGIVKFTIGEAVQALRDTPGTFDVIFNDINKHAYPASLPVIKERLRPGGLLIVDNALWHGRILDDDDRSEDTTGVRELNRLVSEDPDWTASIVPIRDGLLVARLGGKG